MSTPNTQFARLVRPTLDKYFDWDEGNEDEYSLGYYGAVLLKDLGPFKENDYFGGLSFVLQDDGTVDVQIDVPRWIRNKVNGEYVDYWETNPFLVQQFPEQCPYKITDKEEDTEDEIWFEFNLTPYLPIRLTAVLVK